MTPQPKTGSQRNVLRILVAFLTALFLPLALAGGAWAYGGHHHHHHHPSTWTVLVGEESHDHAIQGMAYLPANIWIHAHDTINWKANAAEIHTVTFLAKGQTLASTQPFNPADKNQVGRVGGDVFKAGEYFNSGTMANLPGAIVPTTTSYSLKFPHVGTFTYWCLVHGMAMKGVVHVWPVHRHLPFTQAQYDQRGVAKTAAILHHGYWLWKATARHATNHRVFTGNDDAIAMVMRFIRPTVYVHVGQKVTWKNIGMAAPHTVTFGEEPAPQNLFAPVGNPNLSPGDQKTLSSGIMVPGSHFTVTFTKAGTFKYICALHDYMGMVGKVVVLKHHHHY